MKMFAVYILRQFRERGIILVSELVVGPLENESKFSCNNSEDS